MNGIQVVCIVLCILAIPSVYALQTSPASLTHASADGETRYTLLVTNDESSPLTITLTPNGPLATYLDFEASFTLEPGESRSVPVRLRLPDSLQPGTIESGILIEGSTARGGTVAASAAVMHIVRLVTPRDGAFIAGELLSSSGIVGEEALITVALTNTGSEEYLASPIVYIDGREIMLESIPLRPGESQSLVVPWTPRAVGQYEASAAVTYAEKQATFGALITVGELDVEITRVSLGDFRLGEPFRVSIAALNRWGATLPVAVTTELFQNGSRVATAGPLRLEIDPLQEESFVLFLESTGAQIGPASLKHVAVFAGRERVMTQEVILGFDSIVIVRTEEKTSFSPLTIAIIIVVLVILAVFFIRSRRQRGK